ncbi:MAG: HAD family hydrolase [Candidatus Hodarchaeota archaeon]
MVIQFENVEFIIFDFDGVLFNGYNAIQVGVKDAIEKYDLSVDQELAIDEIASLIQKLMPIPIPRIILQSYGLLQDLTFLGDRSFFKKLRIGLSIYRLYLKEVEENGRMYDGTDEMLEILSSKGIKFAILTSGKKTSVIEKLKEAGIDKYFPEDLIIGAYEVTPGHVKPDPEGIEIIFKKANLPGSLLEKGGLVMVGDMSTDVQAAKAAFNSKGVKSIAIKSGYDSRISDTNPDLLLEKATQILSKLR